MQFQYAMAITFAVRKDGFNLKLCIDSIRGRTHPIPFQTCELTHNAAAGDKGNSDDGHESLGTRNDFVENNDCIYCLASVDSKAKASQKRFFDTTKIMVVRP